MILRKRIVVAQQFARQAGYYQREQEKTMPNVTVCFSRRRIEIAQEFAKIQGYGWE